MLVCLCRVFLEHWVCILGRSLWEGVWVGLYFVDITICLPLSGVFVVFCGGERWLEWFAPSRQLGRCDDPGFCCLLHV